MTEVEGKLAHPIEGLGHVGLHVTDLAAATQFWCGLFGFQITDGSIEQDTVFLSTRPDAEHHMLLLRGGRTAPPDTLVVQQVSWRCASLEAVIDYSHRLRAEGIPTMDVSHGNAVGVYFHDPDGNKCEVYWQTGIPAHQVYLKQINLDRSPSEVLTEVEAHAKEFAETGFREKVPFTLEY